MSETTKKKVFLFVSECSLSYLKIVQMSEITKQKNDIWSIFEKKSGKQFCHVKESTYICSRFLRITTMTTIIIKSKKTNVYHSDASGGLVPMQM